MSTHVCFTFFFPHVHSMPTDDGAPETAAPVDDYGYYYYPPGEYYYEEPTDDQEWDRRVQGRRPSPFDRSFYFTPPSKGLSLSLSLCNSLYSDSDASADACMPSSLCIRALEALACNIKLV